MSERRLTGRGAAAIVKGFLQYLDANQYGPLCLATICADLGLAERTLRAACEVQLGMGPIRYLNHHRMQLVWLALLEADASKITVTQIALDHCFWELGQFSVAYRAPFAESPSATLRRRPSVGKDQRDGDSQSIRVMA